MEPVTFVGMKVTGNKLADLIQIGFKMNHKRSLICSRIRIRWHRMVWCGQWSQFYRPLCRTCRMQGNSMAICLQPQSYSNLCRIICQDYSQKHSVINGNFSQFADSLWVPTVLRQAQWRCLRREEDCMLGAVLEVDQNSPFVEVEVKVHLVVFLISTVATRSTVPTYP